MFAMLLRTLLLYLLLILGIRLMGKRQVGELEPSELVLSLLIADLACVPMQDPGTPLHAGVLPILVLLCATMFLSVLTMKSVALRTLLCGKPSVIIRRGELDQEEMRRNRLTVDELLEELRSQGYTDLSRIYYAVLETNGALSVLPRSAFQPMTQESVDPPPPERGLPVVLISDGRLLPENLRRLGHNDAWLQKQLRRHSCHSVREVFLLSEDECGGLFWVPRQAAKGG